MEQQSRVNKSIKNTAIGMVATILNLLFQFVAKSVFVRLLGEAYNGVNGLFTSILQVLNLAELGFASAIAFALYKPLKDNDQETAAAYMNYFAFVYRLIAIVVAVAGAICIPFLQYLIADDWTQLPFTIGQLRIYFVFYLANTVCSYLLAYKRTIITADQKIFIISISDNLSSILLSVLQIILLLITKNYIAFLSIMVARTIINNIIIHIIASKKYPYLAVYRKSKLKKELKRGLFNNINALMLHKVGTVVIFGVVSIIISAMISVEASGVYSNYITVINGVNMFINIIFNSILASVGNFCVDASPDEKYKMFKKIDFMGSWISIFSLICFINMFNTFIDNIWLGEGHTFGFVIVIIISISAYTTYLRKSINLFKDAMGFFKKDWYKPVIDVFAGIGLAILFGKLWGLTGIVLAFAMIPLFISLPIEVFVTFKYGFEKKYGKYILIQYLRTIFALALSVGIYYLCGLFGLTGVADFVVRSLISIVLSNVILLLVNIKNENLKFYFNMLKKVIMKITKRGKKPQLAVTEGSIDGNPIQAKSEEDETSGDEKRSEVDESTVSSDENVSAETIDDKKDIEE